MREIKYWLLIIRLSFKWMFRTTLGDEIYYQRNRYMVTNGVCPMTWTLDSKFEAKRIECKKIWSLKGMIRSFKRGYNFYMTNWYGIWIMAGIEPWMKDCNIW